jgi:nitroreductase
MANLRHLLDRRSTPSRLLAAPGPTPEQWQPLLSTALRVPDHGKLAPWRLLLIEGEAREALADAVLARALERDPQLPEAAREKEHQRFLFAPAILTVIGCPVAGHKVPEVEQLLSGGALCMNLLLAAQAMGFGAQWLTGWMAYDPVIQHRLGLVAGEQILGFIHIGTPQGEAPERLRPALADKLAVWTP